MSDKWHAENYGDESTLRYSIDDVFDHVNNGNIICIADDLESWCYEMNVDVADVVI